MTHSVYICYGYYAEEVLYVGRTSKGERRIRQHGKAAGWWHRVVWINVTHYSTKELAALREYEAIRELRPEFNVDVTSVFACPPDWTDDMKQAFIRRHPLARFH